MATFLDIGLLKAVGDIFPMILIFALCYGILTSTKIFGENKGLHAIIAVMIALMTLFMPNLLKAIKIIAPWFTMLFIFIIFLLIAYKMFGATDKDLRDVLDIKNSSVTYWILIISIIIIIASLGTVYFNASNSTPSDVVIQNGTVINRGETGAVGTGAFWATFFHPKILGMIMVLLIMTFAVLTLTVVPQMPK